MRFIIPATALLAATACQPEITEIRWDGGTQMLAESCPEHAPNGFQYVPIETMRDVLHNRHEGERLSAHLEPNVLYCSFIGGEEQRPCYRFSGLNITPDRAVQFCIERATDEVFDLVVQE